MTSYYRRIIGNDKACEVFDLMGEGARLIVPFDSNKMPRLVRDPRFLISGFTRFTELEVDKEIVDILINKNLIAPLTKYRNNGKIGWSEMGLDGTATNIYCCIQ